MGVRLTDREAVEAARRGEQQGFAVLYGRYASVLLRQATSCVGDAYTAEDVLQASFLFASQHLDELDDADRVRPWLMSICARQALDVLHARRTDVLSETVPDMPADDRDEPEAGAMANERLEILLDAAEGLPSADRAVIRLYLQGVEGAELAAALGRAPAAGYVRLHRAKRRLRSCIEALLVSRHARHACPDLERLLEQGDGTFAPLLRKRIVRHIEECPDCQARRHRLVRPEALLGLLALLGAPAALRPAVAREIGLTSARTPPGSPPSRQQATGASRPGGGAHRHRGRRRSTRTTMAAGVGAALLVTVGGSAVALHGGGWASDPNVRGQLSADTTGGAPVDPYLGSATAAPGDPGTPPDPGTLPDIAMLADRGGVAASPPDAAGSGPPGPGGGPAPSGETARRGHPAGPAAAAAPPSGAGAVPDAGTGPTDPSTPGSADGSGLTPGTTATTADSATPTPTTSTPEPREHVDADEPTPEPDTSTPDAGTPTSASEPEPTADSPSSSTPTTTGTGRPGDEASTGPTPTTTPTPTRQSEPTAQSGEPTTPLPTSALVVTDAPTVVPEASPSPAASSHPDEATTKPTPPRLSVTITVNAEIGR